MALVAGQIPVSGYQIPDYSGAAAAGGAAAAAPYQMISGLAGQAKDYFKEQGEKKKLVKQSSLQIDAALQLFPDLAPSFQGLKERMKDENIPLADRAAEAEVVSNLLNTGISEMRNRADMSFKREQAKVQNAIDLANLEVSQSRAETYSQKAQAAASELTRDKLEAVDPVTGERQEWDIWKNKQGDIFTNDKKFRITDPDKYIFGEGGVEELPKTSQVGGISDSIAKAAQININQSPSNGVFGFTTKTRDELGRSSVGSRQVSLDFNAAASRDAKGIEIIIPNDATPEERAAANRYVQLTQKFFADRGLDRPIRGVRTAKENGRGTPGRFHTEPFFVGDTEARKIMESDPDGYAQVLANSFNGVQGITFIAPHKKNDPGASDGRFNERDFAKGSIIPALARLSQGDLSQQMAGTPEQRAEIARQIDQYSRMAIAQAAGGVPTEPSLAQQQQQPPVRRLVGGRPIKGNESGTIMTQEQVAELERSGKRVSGVPTADGNFRVTSVSTATQAPRNIKTPQEELQTKRLLTIDEEQSKMRAAGVSDAQNISKFNELLGMLDTGTKTGFGREFLMKAKKVVGRNVADEEDFIARTGEIAMTNIDLTKGAISDREMEYFRTDLSPNIGKTVEGNKRVIQFKLKYAQRSAKIAKTISEMQKQNASPFDIQTKIDEILASDSLITTGSGEGGSMNQAESDASFIRGFQGAD
jgi:hypothetical protein